MKRSDFVNINSSNDKLALIRLAESVVEQLRATKTNEEIYSILKNEYDFTDDFLEQIL